MAAPKNTITFLETGYSDNKIPEAVKCSYCNKIYNKTNGVGSCPRCGGTVNSESSPEEFLIGKIYDNVVKGDFKREKVTNAEMLIA